MALQQESYLAMRIEKRSNGVAVVTLNRPERRIALESLFLTDVDSTEWIFRLRTRAARFLETTLDSRRSIDKLIGQLYGLRSKAVHSGAVPRELAGVATSALLAEGYKVTARAIEQIIEDGRVPNWSTVVLG